MCSNKLHIVHDKEMSMRLAVIHGKEILVTVAGIIVNDKKVPMRLAVIIACP